MYHELIKNVNSKAKDFELHLNRVQTLNTQLISRSEKLLSELSSLLEKVQNNDKKCNICTIRPIRMVFVGCGHCVCIECCNKCKNGRARCFTCRAPVLDAIKVYL